MLLLGGIVREHGQLLPQGAIVGVHSKLVVLLLGGIVGELGDLWEGVGVHDKLAVLLLHILDGHVGGHGVFL